MMGGGKRADPSTALTGNDLAKQRMTGAHLRWVLAGCSSDHCATTVSVATGPTTFGTAARTYAHEESNGFSKSLAR